MLIEISLLRIEISLLTIEISVFSTNRDISIRNRDISITGINANFARHKKILFLASLDYAKKKTPAALVRPNIVVGELENLAQMRGASFIQCPI